MLRHRDETYRKEGTPPQIPVIVLTGRGKTNNMDRALRAGAVAFFQKPVEDAPLLLAIWKALDMPLDRASFND
jgi:FixJ family two-component response regulator